MLSVFTLFLKLENPIFSHCEKRKSQSEKHEIPKFEEKTFLSWEKHILKLRKKQNSQIDNHDCFKVRQWNIQLRFLSLAIRDMENRPLSIHKKIIHCALFVYGWYQELTITNLSKLDELEQG